MWSIQFYIGEEVMGGRRGHTATVTLSNAKTSKVRRSALQGLVHVTLMLQYDYYYYLHIAKHITFPKFGAIQGKTTLKQQNTEKFLI